MSMAESIWRQNNGVVTLRQIARDCSLNIKWDGYNRYIEFTDGSILGTDKYGFIFIN